MRDSILKDGILEKTIVSIKKHKPLLHRNTCIALRLMHGAPLLVCDKCNAKIKQGQQHFCPRLNYNRLDMLLC